MYVPKATTVNIIASTRHDNLEEILMYHVYCWPRYYQAVGRNILQNRHQHILCLTSHLLFCLTCHLHSNILINWITLSTHHRDHLLHMPGHSLTLDNDCLNNRSRYRSINNNTFCHHQSPIVPQQQQQQQHYYCDPVFPTSWLPSQAVEVSSLVSSKAARVKRVWHHLKIVIFLRIHLLRE